MEPYRSIVTAMPTFLPRKDPQFSAFLHEREDSCGMLHSGDISTYMVYFFLQAHFKFWTRLAAALAHCKLIAWVHPSTRFAAALAHCKLIAWVHPSTRLAAALAHCKLIAWVHPSTRLVAALAHCKLIAWVHPSRSK